MGRGWIAAALAAWAVSWAAGAGEVPTPPTDGAGRSLTRIVVMPDASEPVRLAARELQTHVALALGVTLPVVESADAEGEPAFYLGASPLAERHGLGPDAFADDAYAVRSVPEGVLIVGRDYPGGPLDGIRDPFQASQTYNPRLKLSAFGSSGTLFGVYAFLEEALGIRWYWPGELGTVVPPRPARLALAGLDLRGEPAFGYRYPYYCHFSGDDELPLWFKRLGGGGAAPVQINHSFYYFEPLARENPEFYALVDGKREAGATCAAFGSHYCLSNPAFRRGVAAMINRYFDDNPGQTIFPLVPGDGLRRICGCDACQAELDPDGGFSNHIWGFINAVAEAVAARHPRARVGALAYERYFAPPPALDALRDNVIVVFCKQRGYFPAAAFKDKIRRAVAAWREKARDSTFYDWEYYLVHSWLPWRHYPVFFPDLIAEDLRFMAAGGFGGEFNEAGSRTDDDPRYRVAYPGMQHLNLYVTAKLLWDPDRDVDAMLDEYYRLFYGPAEAPMKAFWTTARERWLTEGARNFEQDGALSPTILPTAVFDADAMRALAAHLADAAARTADGSPERARVDVVAGEFSEALAAFGRVVDHKPQTLEVGREAGERLRLRRKDGAKSAFPTYATLRHDGQRLHLDLLAFEPAMDALAAATRDNDDGGAWGDDCLEIFITPDEANRRLGPSYQFIVNVNNARYDARFNPGAATGDRMWDSGFTSEIRREDNLWRATVAIPLAAVQLEAKPGTTFALNLYRMRRAGREEISALAPLFSNAHLDPDKFAKIILR